MNSKIDLNKVRSDAEELFRRGDFFCSEAIVSSVRDNIDPDMPESLISAASGFPVGVGRSKCMCGAISGGVICMGYFFGRTKGRDTKVDKAMAMSHELLESFQENHKVSCCKVLTAGMDMASGEHKAQCVGFTDEMAYKVAEIVSREMNLEVAEG